MTLSATDASAAASLFPDHGVVAVFDARGPEPRWWDVFRRPWAARGVAVAAGEPPAAGPVVALIAAKMIDARTRRVLGELSDDQPFAVLTVEPQTGKFARHGAPLRPRPDVPVSPVEVCIRSRTEYEVRADHLPVKVMATIPESKRQRVLRVSGVQGGTELPTAWLELEPDPDEVLVEVTLVPSRTADYWAVLRDGREVSVRRDEPAAPRVDRLTVVFDRTVTDVDRLCAARDLVRGIEQPTRRRQDYSDFGATPAAAPAPPPEPVVRQADLNAGIRQGVVDGLRAAFQKPVPVDLIWFADCTSSGLGRPKGVTVFEDRGWGLTFGPVKSDDAGPLLADVTYVPGLDLWDDLDGALEAAARAARPAPVLVVGNSPPHPPANPHHPFARLWRAGLSPSAARRVGRLPEALDALADRGVPVAVVFPTGHQTTTEAWGERFRETQGLVQKAFEEVVPTVWVRATAADVARGVQLAVGHLGEWRSGIDVRAEGE